MTDTFLIETRQALRSLAKSPGYTTIVLALVVLAISGNTAVFSIFHAVLLRALPFGDPERLVELETRVPKVASAASANPDFEDWKRENSVFLNMANYRVAAYALNAGSGADQVVAAIVSPNLFSVLRVSPALGRLFTEQEGAGGSHAAILTNALWKRSFNSSHSVIGRIITIDGVPCTIVGVMPPDVEFPISTYKQDIWLANGMDRELIPGRGSMLAVRRNVRNLSVVARLKPGVSVATAQANMRTIARSLQIRYPQTNTNRDVYVIPEAERAVAGSRQALWILFVSMLFLLLVACTNIGALTLSRAMSRRQDMAIRMALGASRGDILRPVIIECSSLAIAGSVLGSLVGIWAANAIVQLLSEMFPHLPEQFHFSAAVLAFSAALCAATIFMAIAPILRTSSGPLSVNARTIVGEGSGASIRGALIAAQVALTLCLLIGASLLMQSLLHLMQTPLGVDTHNALIFEVRAPVVRYSFAKQAIFFRDLTTSLSQIPGVRSATAGEPLPLSRVYTSTRVRLDDNASVDPPAAEFHDVMPNYFETLRIPLIKGRAFGPQDTLTSAPVVIVSESFARANFPAGDALGKRVRVALGLDPPLREIVGIVGDVRQKNIMTAPQPAIYMAHAQFPFSVMSVIMKTNSDPLRFVNASRTVLRGMDQDVAVGSPTRLENVVSGGISLQRITAVVSAVICALALALTGMGLYGIIAYQMQRRAREIGVRIALGAEPLDVLWLSVRRALVLSSIGILCGFAIIWELYPALEGFLYTVSPRDPIILAAAPLFLLAVAAIAGLVPGLRALRCNVSNVLRAD